MFKNLGYKLFAVLLASAFWFFLVTFQNIIYEFEEPLQIEVLRKPEGLEISNALPEVKVKIAAPKGETSFLRIEDFNAYIDLSDREGGEGFADVHVTTERDNVRIVSFLPDRVAVTLEEEKSKSFRVEGDISGVPAGQFIAGTSSHTPKEVVVTGPKSLIDVIARVGYIVQLKGTETESVHTILPLTAYTVDGVLIENGLRMTPSEVEVQLNVIQSIRDKSVPVRLNFADDVDTSRIDFSGTTPKVIVVRAAFEVLPSLQYIETVEVTRAQVEAIMTGEEVRVVLMVPDGVEVVSGESDVIVTIR